VKPTKLWILIADGGRARVLLRDGLGHGLSAVPGLTFEADLPMSHDIGNDRPGRSHESHGQTRHAIEPHSDPHQQLKSTFLASLVSMLETHMKEKAFDQLAIIAPPAALGIMRPLLSGPLRAVVVAEIHKDLTKIPNSEVAAHIGDDIRL
jgi:protein required for attachment to host cells